MAESPFVRAVERLVAPLARRVRMLLGRAVLRLVDDAKRIQELQVEGYAGELLSGVERFQDYGISSHPHPGAEVVIGCVGGIRSHAIALRVDDRRYRPTGLAEGEVLLYTSEGDHVHLRRGRIIEVVAGAKLDVTAPVVEVQASTSATVTSPVVTVIASSKVTLTTPVVEVSGNLEVGGSAVITGPLSSAVSVSDPTGSMQGMRGVFNGHTHVENDGVTDPPAQEM